MLKQVPYQALCEDTWRSLESMQHNPMQDRAWVDAAVKTFGGGQADVILVGNERNPDGMAVILGSSDWGAGKRCLGDSVTAEATGLLARNDQALNELAKGIVRLKRAVNFGHYPIQDGLVTHLKQAAGRRALVATRQSTQRAWPSLEFDGGWPQVKASLSRSRRQGIARKWRKAEKIGQVRVEINSPSLEECDALLQSAFEVQAKGWKGRAGTAIIENPVEFEFYRAFARSAMKLDQFRICCLHIGEAIAATQVCTIWKERFWSIAIGYDEDFSKISPGELLTFELIKWAAEQGLKSFEFCGKEADWTRRWTTAAIPVHTVRYYPLNPYGLATLVDHSRHEVKKAAARLFPTRT